jgi:hypothetical protein
MPPEASRRTPAALAETRERRSQVRALLWLALLVIFGSILRFGVHRVFTHGWWRLW